MRCRRPGLHTHSADPVMRTRGKPACDTPGLGASPESAARLQVACTDKEFPLNELKVQPHGAMLEAMAGSVFCLIMPGNSQSSQRLTEAFIAGCIPVFLGPPWHTLPFSTEVRPPLHWIIRLQHSTRVGM